ncbi:carbohydrate ABC transporter permease [Salsuginibacillus kocurii]|uniref:carbohydrate ABC transporter permease n=1 Tax=Salsuginibacillus kocurii TaxID=427078 RepID=UPI0003633BC6|nr:carbohydrate ABC transporter permease [Salsuginibacillus kocurii]
MKQRKNNTNWVEILGIFLALTWLAPFYLMVVNSFKTNRDIFEDVLGLPPDAVFANYAQAFQDLDFVNALWNSTFITVTSIAFIIAFSSMAGYALARNKSKLSGTLLLIFVSAMLIPFQAVMITLTSFFSSFNMLNQYGLIFMYLGFGCSLAIFLYHGAMTGISLTLDEAATIDGANRFQTFWYIIFPLLKPISVTVAILNVIWIWNDYLLPSLVLSSEEATIPINMYYFFGEYTRQWDLALAGLTLAIIPIIIFYFFAQKQIISGVTDGAVK